MFQDLETSVSNKVKEIPKKEATNIGITVQAPKSSPTTSHSSREMLYLLARYVNRGSNKISLFSQ